MLFGQFVKFMMVGVVNTIFSYCVYAIFIFFHFHYIAASLLQFVISTMFNFNTIGKVVFKNKDKRLVWRFALVCLFMYGLYVGGLKLLNMTGLNDYATGAILVLPISVLSYFLNKIFVFTSDKA